MVSNVSKIFKNGFSKNGSSQVSRAYFEAISIGVLMAGREKGEIIISESDALLIINDSEFKDLINGKYHTHTKRKLKGRIEFVCKKLIERNKA